MDLVLLKFRFFSQLQKCASPTSVSGQIFSMMFRQILHANRLKAFLTINTFLDQDVGIYTADIFSFSLLFTSGFGIYPKIFNKNNFEMSKPWSKFQNQLYLLTVIFSLEIFIKNGGFRRIFEHEPMSTYQEDRTQSSTWLQPHMCHTMDQNRDSPTIVTDILFISLLNTSGHFRTFTMNISFTSSGYKFKKTFKKKH